MTLVIAHRGASRAEPENTVAAFERAVEFGAELVELDVRRTADDHLVVHHDAHLVDGRPIVTTRHDELPPNVPSLAAALDACAGIGVNIEIKNDQREPDFDPHDWVAARVGAELARRGGGPRWLISSFRWETIERCRVVAPDARTAFLVVDVDETTIRRVADAGHDALHPWDGAVDEPVVRAAHTAGLAVNVWTCDDPDRMRSLMRWGVDGICTNVPDIALRERRR